MKRRFVPVTSIQAAHTNAFFFILAAPDQQASLTSLRRVDTAGFNLLSKRLYSPLMEDEASSSLRSNPFREKPACQIRVQAAVIRRFIENRGLPETRAASFSPAHGRGRGAEQWWGCALPFHPSCLTQASLTGSCR